MRKVVMMICSAMLIFFCISCGSKPAPEEPEKPAPVVETPKPEPEPEPAKVDNGAALKGIDDARKLALDSGVKEYEPEKLQAIDALYDKIKAKSDNGEDISADSKDLADRYAALAAYVKACKVNEDIDDTDMVDLAEAMYDKGYNYLLEYEDLFNDPNSTGKAQLEKANSANTTLIAVYAIIFKQMTKDARADALLSKKDAESVRAQIAQKDKYNKAVDLFKKGDSAYTMMAYDRAYDNYIDATDLFDELYDDIAEKRAAALKKIEEAKLKVKESEDYALQADKKAPMKTKLEGIEDEDAVLLEEDDYEDPSKAEADLPETVKEAIIGDDAK
jgi:hypothetical protein